MSPSSSNIKFTELLPLPVTTVTNILLYTINTRSFAEIHHMVDHI